MIGMDTKAYCPLRINVNNSLGAGICSSESQKHKPLTSGICLYGLQKMLLACSQATAVGLMSKPKAVPLKLFINVPAPIPMSSRLLQYFSVSVTRPQFKALAIGVLSICTYLL